MVAPASQSPARDSGDWNHETQGGGGQADRVREKNPEVSFCFLNWSLGSKVFVLFPFLCIVLALLTVGYISVNKKASLVTAVMATATRGTGKRRKIVTTRGSPPYHIMEPEEQTSGWKNLKLSFAVVLR